MNEKMKFANRSSNQEANARSVCGLLTPHGRGAIAVVVLIGSRAEKTLDELFCSVSGIKLAQDRQREIFYGRWKATEEDVVVVRMPAGNIEIHCHGGETVPATIMSDLRDLGFDVLDRQELAHRLHAGRWETETILAMTRAVSDKTAGILLQQYSLVAGFLAELGELIAGNPDRARAELNKMVAWADFGRHLTEPWTVVFAGRPNVGKSSLMNAIVGFDRAIVHEIAGTTRDVVSHVTAIEGWPVEIKDTAGLRNSEESIEQMGIERARNIIRDADLLVAVMDASQAPNEFDAQLLQLNPDLIVANKIDLGNNRAVIAGGQEVIETSASFGQGIDLLIETIATRLVDGLPPQSLLIPINDRQVDLLRSVASLISNDQFAEALDVWQQSR